MIVHCRIEKNAEPGTVTMLEQVATIAFWNVLTLRLNQTIDYLFSCGSIGIHSMVEEILPLRDRLESGERTEELKKLILEAIEKHDGSGPKKP